MTKPALFKSPSTKPNPSSNRPATFALFKPLLWGLFVLTMVALGLDVMMGFEQKLVRGLLAGALIGFLTQCVFIYLSYRHSLKYCTPNQALTDMSLAMLVKWLVATTGFAAVFVLPIALLPVMVFGGFVLMYVWYWFLLFSLRLT